MRIGVLTGGGDAPVFEHPDELPDPGAAGRGPPLEEVAPVPVAHHDRRGAGDVARVAHIGDRAATRAAPASGSLPAPPARYGRI